MAQFDLQNDTVRALNQALHNEESANQQFEVLHPGGKHNVATGARFEAAVDIQGHVGYYCAGMNQNAQCNGEW